MKKECIHVWEEIDELFAITRMEKKGDAVTFLPSVGLPVVLDICNKCGELKISIAKSRGKI
ncbi:MAG: hypothetical protein AABX82_09395 [Nanoarchaeota archaeon]